METRIAVCDSSRMRFLAEDDNSVCGLVELEDLVHEQSRQRPQVTGGYEGATLPVTHNV